MTDTDVGRVQPGGIPARAGLDRTAGLLVEGYAFLAERRRRWGAGRTPATTPSSCACSGSGPSVSVGRRVRLLYDPGRFRRRDAIPRPLAFTLFGKNAVHLHDGPAHRHRKAMLLGLLDPGGRPADRYGRRPAVAGGRGPLAGRPAGGRL